MRIIDTVWVAKTAYDEISVLWIPAISLIFYIVAIIISAKWQKKVYSSGKETLANDFKEGVKSQLATLQASVITWDRLDNHRKENESSVKGLHERIDRTNEGLYALAKETNGKLSDVSIGISHVKNSLSSIADSLDRHIEKGI